MWAKRNVYVLTALLRDADEDGEPLNWSEPYEEYTAESMEEAEKLRQELLENDDYSNVIISDAKEQREFLISEKEYLDTYLKGALDPALAFDEKVAITDEFFNFEHAWHNVDQGIPDLAERFRNGEDIRKELAQFFFRSDVNMFRFDAVYGERKFIIPSDEGVTIEDGENVIKFSWEEVGSIHLGYLLETFRKIQLERVREYPELKDEVEKLLALAEERCGVYKKRCNRGYEIIESCTVGGTELVIGYNPKAVNPYVCWYCKDGDNYFWGYYCNEISEARKILNERYDTKNQKSHNNAIEAEQQEEMDVPRRRIKR